jgi:hypothetical protein
VLKPIFALLQVVHYLADALRCCPELSFIDKIIEFTGHNAGSSKGMSLGPGLGGSAGGGGGNGNGSSTFLEDRTAAAERRKDMTGRQQQHAMEQFKVKREVLRIWEVEVWVTQWCTWYDHLSKSLTGLVVAISAKSRALLLQVLRILLLLLSLRVLLLLLCFAHPPVPAAVAITSIAALPADVALTRTAALVAAAALTRTAAIMLLLLRLVLWLLALQVPGRHLLISTSAAEEGVDVPTCSFVVRYNVTTSGVQRIQSKGRSRAQVSEFVTLLQDGDVTWGANMGAREVQMHEKSKMEEENMLQFIRAQSAAAVPAAGAGLGL